MRPDARSPSSGEEEALVSILVVDDVEENLLVMEAILSRPGLRLLRAQSGAEALELLLAHEVALALLDVQMPRMDGFELAELMRGIERTRAIPIVFVTAGSRDQARQFRGYEAGAVDFLYKPVDPHVLRSKVEVFVALHAQRRAAEDQLAQLREALRINEMLMAVLGHDLRTPLSAVVNCAEVVRRTPGVPDTVRASGERIRASADRMGRMISQLLDLARLRAGKLELCRLPGDLGALATHIVGEVEAGAATERVRLEAEGDLRGHFDKDRVSQILSNLLGNALQHGDPAQPVRLRLDGTDPASLRFTVRNGGTIPAARLASLFEAFGARGEEAAAAGQGGGMEEGLGLGLHIVDRFVRAHGGTVQADSDAASGTCFEVTLPREPA